MLSVEKKITVNVALEHTHDLSYNSNKTWFYLVPNEIFLWMKTLSGCGSFATYINDK